MNIPQFFAQGLTELDLEGCSTLHDEDLVTACTLLPNLQSIDVKGAEKLSDVALLAIARECTALATLQVSTLLCVLHVMWFIPTGTCMHAYRWASKCGLFCAFVY